MVDGDPRRAERLQMCRGPVPGVALPKICGMAPAEALDVLALEIGLVADPSPSQELSP
jgi:hypothetical protein